MLPVDREEFTEPGPTLRIHCPQCHGRGVEATSHDFHTSERVLVFVTKRTVQSWVTCGKCGAAQRSRTPVRELERLAPEALLDHLYPDSSLVEKVLACAAVPVALAPPPFGPTLALVAILATRRSSTWPRDVAQFAGFASIVISSVWLALLVAAVIVRK